MIGLSFIKGWGLHIGNGDSIPQEKPNNTHIAEAEEKTRRRKYYIVRCGWKDANRAF